MGEVIEMVVSYISVLVDMRPQMKWQDKVNEVKRKCSERQLCALIEFASWFENE